jgi:hypothetical protein
LISFERKIEIFILECTETDEIIPHKMTVSRLFYRRYFDSSVEKGYVNRISEDLNSGCFNLDKNFPFTVLINF